MAGHLHYGGNVIPDTLQPIPVTRHHAAKRCYLRCKTTKLGGTSTISVATFLPRHSYYSSSSTTLFSSSNNTTCAWSRSVNSHTCYAYCQGALPCLVLPFQSIHLHFFPKPLPNFFLCWAAE